MERAMSRSRESSRNIRELLEMAGARIRSGERADCPKHRSYRTMSFDEKHGVFHCHDAKCGWSGNIVTLSKELGLRAMNPVERRRLRQEIRQRERQERDNRELSRLLRSRLRQFDRMERVAHERGAELLAKGKEPGRVQWAALEIVNRKREALVEALDRVDGVTVKATPVSELRYLSERDFGPESQQYEIGLIEKNTSMEGHHEPLGMVVSPAVEKPEMDSAPGRLSSFPSLSLRRVQIEFLPAPAPSLVPSTFRVCGFSMQTGRFETAEASGRLLRSRDGVSVRSLPSS